MEGGGRAGESVRGVGDAWRFYRGEGVKGQGDVKAWSRSSGVARLDFLSFDLLTPPMFLSSLLVTATPRPLWPIVLIMTVVLALGLPFMLRVLWPNMKRQTAWLIALGVAVFFALVLAPAMVALSSNLRSGRSM